MGPNFSDLPTCPEIDDDLIVGVFHESRGPMTKWPRKTEGVRRGLVDGIEGKAVTDLLFFRWRSWVMVAGRRDSFNNKHLLLFEGVEQMARTGNIKPTNLGLFTLDSWVGHFLLERTCRRWDTTQTPTEDILGSRDSTIQFDEIHFSGGSTFGLKGLITLPGKDFEGENFVRLDMMMRETRLMVYTVERVDESIKTNSKGILEFGRPENGFCWKTNKRKAPKTLTPNNGLQQIGIFLTTGARELEVQR
jgi:hypothetical protein